MKEQKALAIFDFFVQKVIFWFGVDTSIVRHNIAVHSILISTFSMYVEGIAVVYA